MTIQDAAAIPGITDATVCATRSRSGRLRSVRLSRARAMTSRSVACNPSGPPSSSSAAPMPRMPSAATNTVRCPGGYHRSVPSGSRRASKAWRTSTTTGTAFKATKIAAASISLAASSTTAALTPAMAAAATPSHSPARNSGNCVR